MKKIKKLVLFSRHSIRYAIGKDDYLYNLYNKNFINWDVKEATLTKKGEICEYEFAKYLKKYIENLDFEIKTKNVCSNSMRRTFLTGRINTLYMFPDENLKVNMKYEDFSKLDPVFNNPLKSQSYIDEELLKKIEIENKDKINKLEKILKLNENDILKHKSRYFFIDDNIALIDGALKIVNMLVDSFICKYYNEFDEKDIFESDNFEKDLFYLSDLNDIFVDSIFGVKKYNDNTTINIFDYIKEKINSENDLEMLFGHDSNICTIFERLNLDYKKQDDMLEKYPIGGKLLFKIYDDNTMDLELIYQPPKNIRNNIFEYKHLILKENINILEI